MDIFENDDELLRRLREASLSEPETTGLRSGPSPSCAVEAALRSAMREPHADP